MAVLLTQYDGFTKGEEVPILYMPIWLQIHKLPDGYCRHELIVKLLRSAGEVLETRINGNSHGDYVRVRVRHDIRRPLTRFVSIAKGKNRSVYAVRYEKLARFCSVCGIIRHEHKECGNGVFAEKDLKFGDYLYADPPVRVRQDWDGNRNGKKSNADLSIPKPTTSKEGGLGEGDLKDTASSPHKPSQTIDMDLDKTSGKRLHMEEGVVSPSLEGLSIPGGGRLLITDGKETDEATSPSNSSGDEILKGKTPVLDMRHGADPQSMPKRKLVWPCPAEHEVALSVDGSFHAVDGSAGSGMILRDSTWAVIFASYRKLFHCNDALESELQAIKEGLKLATEHSQATIILQSDCDEALKMIADASSNISAYGHLVSDIREYMNIRAIVPVKILREQNRVAHCLANFGICGDSTACWLGRPPPCIRSLVAEDCNTITME
ncbi:hypothetical protein D1007_08983 [Hordeum vulgare]|nr:hypothetical protein D1007_08983 [Hordeum vulgare]